MNQLLQKYWYKNKKVRVLVGSVAVVSVLVFGLISIIPATNAAGYLWLNLFPHSAGVNFGLVFMFPVGWLLGIILLASFVWRITTRG